MFHKNNKYSDLNWKNLTEKIKKLPLVDQQVVMDDIIRFLTIEEIIQMGLDEDETTMMIQRKVVLDIGRES